MTDNFKGQHSIEIFLSAGECNAEGKLPVQALVQHLINAATSHANSLNFGYNRLIASGCAWVLSRLAIEMTSYPCINNRFKIVTWVVATNKFYSDRAFRIEDSDGNTLGHAITTWMAIDIEARKAANLEKLFPEGLPDTGVYPPIEAPSRIAHISQPDTMSDYTFRYCDIDCNRHVNSTRYVELILNMFSVDFFDKHTIQRLEISYHSEARFGETVKIACKSEPPTAIYEIIRDETPITRFKISFCTTV